MSVLLHRLLRAASCRHDGLFMGQVVLLELMHELLPIPGPEAIATSKLLAQKEGILTGAPWRTAIWLLSDGVITAT